ncbi:3-hydroxyisobutyrate dehydrogenase [Micromonospora pallida]|uniref:3-hydroxyisobutyrate dehydrogenase n=1 Tax=Micromonospora pallida TaxID=145854 RepID=A0A1C6SG26_9ACTN|nr:3-hydroxyisobutyrate dehydrogenase [Micromonospora pallida]
MKCAVIGLGEAGGRYATALADQGHEVIGVDPADNPTPDGVRRVGSVQEAATGAEFVLVMTGAAASPGIARAVAPYLLSGVCYADFTSSAPAVMEQLARVVEATGASFADVAILGPVTWHGAHTPLMVSGSGAGAVEKLMRTVGAKVEPLDAPAGAAMAHKLLRSVFMKGIASTIWEAVEAGRVAGYEQWARDQIASQLAGDGHAVIERLLTGTRLHAERRSIEMKDTAAYLESLGVTPVMTRATEASLRRIAAAQ